MSEINSHGKIRNRRHLRNYWINPQFQGRYIFWVTLTGLALVAINATIFYLFTRENYALLVELSPMTDEAKGQLYHELHQIVGFLLGGSASFLLVTSVVGLVFSHRAAGPMFHIRRVCDAVRGGDVRARVHLRPHDDFQEVGQAINAMLDVLEKQ
ncbi:HAMP domain-containing protein [Bdellovibrionota bacterium FG-1]